MKICPIPKWTCEVNVMHLWNISPGGPVTVNVRRLRCSVSVIDQLNPINENTGMRGKWGVPCFRTTVQCRFWKSVGLQNDAATTWLETACTHSRWGWQVRSMWLCFVWWVFVKANVHGNRFIESTPRYLICPDPPGWKRRPELLRTS